MEKKFENLTLEEMQAIVNEKRAKEMEKRAEKVATFAKGCNATKATFAWLLFMFAGFDQRQIAKYFEPEKENPDGQGISNYLQPVRGLTEKGYTVKVSVFDKNGEEVILK